MKGTVVMRKYLVASACVLAGGLFASPAFADGVAATAQGTFGNILGFPSWSIDGSVSAPIGWEGLSVEGNLGDRGFDSVHIFDGGGDLIWSDPNFRVAGSVKYNRLTALGSSTDVTQFGAAGQYFFGDMITASVQGGANTGGLHGGYVGGNLKWYFMPDVALDGFVNYNDLNHSGGFSAHETDYGAHAEWLPWETMPISLNANYTHVHLSAFGSGGDTDTWWVGLKLYLNDSPATTLVDRQRTGTLDTLQPNFNFVF